MNNYFQYEWYRNNEPIKNNNYSMNNIMLDNPKTGFEKGNMFNNLYSQYKNYSPAKIETQNEKEKMLMDISAICFAAHELNLYLDLNPDDQSTFMLFMDYEKKANRMIEEYERMYGPLNINNEDMKSFTWATDKWPWEVRNV